MAELEKVIKCLELCRKLTDSCEGCPYENVPAVENCMLTMHGDALELLKEQEAMNVDVFVQWCIDSHIMGDATVRGIKYWVGKYKEIKEGR